MCFGHNSVVSLLARHFYAAPSIPATMPVRNAILAPAIRGDHHSQVLAIPSSVCGDSCSGTGDHLLPAMRHPGAGAAAIEWVWARRDWKASHWCVVYSGVAHETLSVSTRMLLLLHGSDSVGVLATDVLRFSA